MRHTVAIVIHLLTIFERWFFKNSYLNFLNESQAKKQLNTIPTAVRKTVRRRNSEKAMPVIQRVQNPLPFREGYGMGVHLPMVSCLLAPVVVVSMQQMSSILFLQCSDTNCFTPIKHNFHNVSLNLVGHSKRNKSREFSLLNMCELANPGPGQMIPSLNLFWLNSPQTDCCARCAFGAIFCFVSCI